MSIRENKVYKIINEDFDARMSTAVITYIMEKGINLVESITDEDIENMDVPQIMTPEFGKAMVKTARRICKECDLFNDILPFIRKYMPLNSCETHEITLEKSNFSDYEWEDLLDTLDIDQEELDEDEYGSIDVVAVDVIVCVEY